MQKLLTTNVFTDHLRRLGQGYSGGFYNQTPLELGPALVEDQNGQTVPIEVTGCESTGPGYSIRYTMRTRPAAMAYEEPAEPASVVSNTIARIRASPFYTERSDASRHVAIAITELENAYLRLVFASQSFHDSTEKEVKP